MVNMKIRACWEEKIDESNLRHVELELLMGYADGAAQQERENVVQKIRRRLRDEIKILDSDHHSDKMRNFQGRMYRRKFDSFFLDFMPVTYYYYLLFKLRSSMLVKE